MKKNILLISPHSKVKLKEPPIYGFEKRLAIIGRILEKKYNLIILEPDDVKDKENISNIKFHFKSLSFLKIENMRFGSFFLDFNPFFINKLVKLINNYSPDIIIISFPWGILSTDFIMRKILGKKFTLIYNSHNVESEYSKIISKSENIPKLVYLLYKGYIAVLEKLGVNLSDYIISVSEENKKTFVKKYACNEKKIWIINAGAEIPKEIQKRKNPFKESDEDIIVFFHGAYNETHNKEAIDLIQSEISLKLKDCINLKFIVAGTNLPKLKRDNLLSVGFIENLAEFIATCDIAIVPLKSGEGTKLKIFDYMAAGLPIITTKKGAEGMKFTNGINAIITDSVDENFENAIRKLANDKQLRLELGKKSLELLINEFGIKKIENKIYSLIDDI